MMDLKQFEGHNADPKKNYVNAVNVGKTYPQILADMNLLNKAPELLAEVTRLMDAIKKIELICDDGDTSFYWTIKEIAAEALK